MADEGGARGAWPASADRRFALPVEEALLPRGVAAPPAGPVGRRALGRVPFHLIQRRQERLPVPEPDAQVG